MLEMLCTDKFGNLYLNPIKVVDDDDYHHTLLQIGG